MTNGANYKKGKLHHGTWHSDIRTPNQLNTSAHPCTALTQRVLCSQIFESRLNSIRTRCMFGLPKLVSENRFCGPKSIERSSERENRVCSSYGKTATKSAINCQSRVSLQSSAIGSKHNHFNFGAPQFPRTACIQPSFHCLP
jgi:hypothetical protein